MDSKQEHLNHLFKCGTADLEHAALLRKVGSEEIAQYNLHAIATMAYATGHAYVTWVHAVLRLKDAPQETIDKLYHLHDEITQLIMKAGK